MKKKLIFKKNVVVNEEIEVEFPFYEKDLGGGDYSSTLYVTRIDEDLKSIMLCKEESLDNDEMNYSIHLSSFCMPNLKRKCEKEEFDKLLSEIHCVMEKIFS